MDNNSKKQISRRDFLKIAGAAGVTTAGLAACNDGKNTAGAENNIDGKPGQMTYRTNPKTGEKVSLLGFGMMRLPFTEKNAEGQEEIDQEMVNELVDYAFKHGVNYFDTSPAYCRGLSERATGIALARYPRDKYFIATKLSNFAPSTRTREASMEMYHNSLKYLQTDYIDYMLLHSVGGGSDSMAEYEERYINNGILDFLIKEREAGRIRNIGFSYHGDIRVFDRLLSEHDKYKWDFVQIQLNYLDWRYAKQINESNTNAEYLYNELAKRNIPAIIMEPLLGGKLANPSPQVAKMLFDEKTPVEWAMDFLWNREEVSLLLSGMGAMEQVQSNIDYADKAEVGMLTEENLDMLAKTKDVFDKMALVPCTKCAYCMPCPFGLDIPKTFEAYNATASLGTDRAKAIYAELNKGADQCKKCKKCEKVCPQSIKISHTMTEIAKIFAK